MCQMESVTYSLQRPQWRTVSYHYKFNENYDKKVVDVNSLKIGDAYCYVYIPLHL